MGNKPAVALSATALVIAIFGATPVGNAAKKLFYTQEESDARYLPIAGKAADADMLDGFDSLDFLRSDAALDADTLDGMDSAAFAQAAVWRTTTNDTTEFAFAMCEVGERVVGGGALTSPNRPLAGSYPAATDGGAVNPIDQVGEVMQQGWAVTVESAPGEELTIYTYALCAPE